MPFTDNNNKKKPPRYVVPQKKARQKSARLYYLVFELEIVEINMKCKMVEDERESLIQG